jgi:hypothetical protein
MKKHGTPGYMVFAARRLRDVPHTARQDNYLPLRQLLLIVLTLVRMIERGGRSGPIFYRRLTGEILTRSARKPLLSGTRASV